jgi:hypothetical protein
VDEWITVEEKAIGQAIVFMVEKHHKVRKMNQFRFKIELPDININ